MTSNSRAHPSQRKNSPDTPGRIIPPYELSVARTAQRHHATADIRTLSVVLEFAEASEAGCTPTPPGAAPG
jgi:hypothetical protein